MAGSAGGLEVGLERAIADLVAQLDDAERRRLAVAALLGNEAPIASIATVAGDDPGGVAAALARAADLGLVTLDGEHARVVHDAVREAAVAMLPRANRLALHARAAALLVGSAPDVVARRAHHAIEAAPASTDAAARAVVTLREAAALLGRTSGFETAAALLARASAIHAAASPAAPSAALAVEHAEAVLACGRLTDSRDLFRHAARSAEREGDARALAQAALGLGGMWISEHRLASEADAVRALQQRALDGLPAGERVLRARLAVRLAAEASYRGSSIAPVLAALEDVRETGDARALAEALSLAHHALLTPEHVGRRLVIAIELIAAATNADDDLLALVGVCWRAVDLFALGHPRAAAALDELRARADALGCRSLSFIARAIDVMLAIRAGAFDRAEADAAACVALGREVGDADALAYHGAHLAAIRYFQGREAELVDLTSAMASSATLVEQRERAFASAAALFACRAGHPEPGRALLARITRDGIASVPVSSSWLTTVAGIAELSLLLDDVAVAQAAYGALLRHAHLPVMASLAIVCFGSTHRPLALAAQACGHLDLAITHFRAAVAANDEIGHRPAAVLCRAELGLAHLRRRSGDDDTIGRRLVSDAIADAERLGMDALAARWRAATPLLPRAGDALVDVGMARLDGGRWRNHRRQRHRDRSRPGRARLPQRAGRRPGPEYPGAGSGAPGPQQCRRRETPCWTARPPPPSASASPSCAARPTHPRTRGRSWPRSRASWLGRLAWAAGSVRSPMRRNGPGPRCERRSSEPSRKLARPTPRSAATWPIVWKPARCAATTAVRRPLRRRTPDRGKLDGSGQPVGPTLCMKIGLVSLGCPKNLVDSEVMLGLAQGAGHELTEDAAAGRRARRQHLRLHRPGQAGVDRHDPRAGAAQDQRPLPEAGGDRLPGRALPRRAEGRDPRDRRGARHRRGRVDRRRHRDGAGDGRAGRGRPDDVPPADVAPVSAHVAARHRDAVVAERRELPTYLYDADDAARPDDAEALRLREDRRGLRLQLRLLHHPEAARPVPQPAGRVDRRRGAGPRRPRRQGAAPDLAGLDLLRRRPPRARRAGPAAARAERRSTACAWIRLLYLYPTTVTDETIEAMADLRQGRALHRPAAPARRRRRPEADAPARARAPATSGCCSGLRERLPDVTLRTTFIVGFPGETEADFAELCDFVKTVEFDHVGVFTYSHEEGTAAHALGDDVPARTKAARQRKLMALQQRIVARRHRAPAGRAGPGPGRRPVVRARAGLDGAAGRPGARDRPHRLPDRRRPGSPPSGRLDRSRNRRFARLRPGGPRLSRRRLGPPEAAAAKKMVDCWVARSGKGDRVG